MNAINRLHIDATKAARKTFAVAWRSSSRLYARKNVRQLQRKNSRKEMRQHSRPKSRQS
jgi:hypothetical protein